MVDRNMQIRGGQIKDGSISEAKIDIANSPVDGYLLRFNQSSGQFEWVSGNDAVTEIPSGAINGVNQSYTITSAPQSGTLHLYLNGLYQEEGAGNDYLLSGTDITFVIAPDTGDVLVASYIKSVAGASLAHEQNTDQFLDEGGVNESTAADVKDAVDKKHAHANSAELDLVSDGDHDARADNPHGVNKTDVGLANVPNLDTTNAVNNEHTHTNSVELSLVTDGDHDVRSDNPHSVSKAQVGLTNVDNINATVSNLQYVLDAGDSALTTGIKGQIEVPFNCTITAAVLIADQAGSIVVDIKRSTYSGFPTTASIAAAAKPTLSASQKMQDSTLSGWTTTLSAGDIIEYVVDSASTVQRVLVSLMVERT